MGCKQKERGVESKYWDLERLRVMEYELKVVVVIVVVIVVVNSSSSSSNSSSSGNSSSSSSSSSSSFSEIRGRGSRKPGSYLRKCQKGGRSAPAGKAEIRRNGRRD